MTIRKGEPWGVPSEIGSATLVAGSDAEFAACARQVVLLTAGNLHTALGSPAPKAPGAACTVLEIDGLECTVKCGGETFTVPAVADVVVGSWFSRNGLIVATNGGLLHGRNVAPRAHPNDGEWDILEVHRDMSLRARFEARRRSSTGVHVPHPHIRLSRFREITLQRRGRQTLTIDGSDVGNWTSVSLRVKPDAHLVAV